MICTSKRALHVVTLLWKMICTSQRVLHVVALLWKMICTSKRALHVVALLWKMICTSKRALHVVALLWKMICNLGDPMSLRHPVIYAWMNHLFSILFLTSISMWIRMFAWGCACVCLQMYLYFCVCVCALVCMCLCICECVCVFVYLCVCVCVYTGGSVIGGGCQDPAGNAGVYVFVWEREKRMRESVSVLAMEWLRWVGSLRL